MSFVFSWGCFGFKINGGIFENKTIQPDGDDVNNDQDWDQNKPLILKLVGKLLNPEDRQVAGDQSENKSANAGGIQGSELSLSSSSLLSLLGEQ